MAESYRAILINGHLQWLDDVPEAIRQGTGKVRIRVTVEEYSDRNGDELGALLDELADADPFGDIDDPVSWQQKLRRE